MVESKLVELAVAGSSPVGHPILHHQRLADAGMASYHNKLPHEQPYLRVLLMLGAVDGERQK